MEAERKKILQYALERDVQDVSTYSGYKGDLIVKITTKDKNALREIRQFALSIGVQEVAVKQNLNLVEYEIYCVTPDKNVYKLKTDEKDDSVKHSEYVEDAWKKTILN